MNVLALFQWGRRSPEGRRAYDARRKYEYRNRRADGSERVEIWISDPAVWRLICEAEENSSLAKITEQHVGEACRQFKRERAEAELAMVSRIRVGAVDREPHPPRDCYLIKRNRLGVEPVLMVDEQEQVGGTRISRSRRKIITPGELAGASGWLQRAGTGEMSHLSQSPDR